MKRRLFTIFFMMLETALCMSCASTGTVNTVQTGSKQAVIPEPERFAPALADLNAASNRLSAVDDEIDEFDSIKSPHWVRLLSWQQAYDTAREQQNVIENELERTGELALQPDASYSFDLESYCVHPGNARPVNGDGLRVAPLRGPAKDWISEILKVQGLKKISQERVQYLIWALLTDTRYDELSTDEQAVLLQYYPDAAIRFGNRRLENLAADVFQSLFPDASESIENLSALRSQLIESRNDYKQLSESLTPRASRINPIPVGWLQMDQGYLIRARSEGYEQIHIDIYVPEEVGRNPKATHQLVFRPWEWVALPDQGQRLGISTRVIRSPAEKLENNSCKKLRAWRPKSCHEMSDRDRKVIVATADPKNFPKTRYQSPPAEGTKLEEVTDCSHFVNEILKRNGFEFQYAPTSRLECLSVFKVLPQDQARPGDLILYTGHVGFINEEGEVISATQGGPQKRSQLDSQNPKFIPSITRLEKRTAGNNSWKILRWSCP